MGIFSKKTEQPPAPEPETLETPPSEAVEDVVQPDEAQDDLGEDIVAQDAQIEAEAESAEDDDAKEAEMDKLRKGFDAAYYLSHNPDVLRSGDDPFDHYMLHGWKEGRRPNGWFVPEEYVARHPTLDPSEINPFVHFMIYRDLPGRIAQADLQALRQNRVFYWADKHLDDDEEGARPVIIASNMPGKEELRIVRAHFDAEYYTAQNPDLADKWIDPLLHFMTLGWIELRDPNRDFSVSYYLRKNKDIRRQGLNPYVHYLKHGHREKWRQSASVADVKILDLFEDNPEMGKLVAAAKALDPMVAMPGGQRIITSPLKAAAETTDVARALRRRLAGKTYRYVVAVPHVRMSGASRVASIFAEALSNVADPSEILVITTDSSESEYIEWFSDKLDIFDLSKEITTLGPEDKIRALIDLLRGVECHTFINVNSRLVWEAMRLYGRQLYHEFRIVTYLFTWDENVRGDRVGYPIQWLRDTADHHHLLLTDTKNLANDVADRLGFDQTGEAPQVVPVYTPITGEAAVATLAKRRSGAGHFLWAGRFDPQKRLDLLVAIARANPDMTFDVYGKTVLGKKGLAEFDPPENIIEKGTYSDLQEVLDTPYNGFLYTAQWDGLPTILLDMAAAGLPIAASNVGGISEMLDKKTGWLVKDFEDIDAYSAALAEMAADPEEAQKRVAALQTRLGKQFALKGYINGIKKMVKTYDL
ncbi:glycosyltransferase family 4 protein [Sulfitobacter sp. HNIBRBA2951]|uniref:glycosyltransferase family 4 protein n=1 Tax=Sulfitobacter aquimarinus TaxID=3158557 RepID=UPI0032E002F2